VSGHREDGFTLIEVLVVVVVLGALIAIAVPSYLGFRGSAQDTSAQHALHQTLVAANAYGTDNDDYSTLTLAKLRKSYDATLPDLVKLSSKTSTYYCLKAVSDGGETYWLRGPEGIQTEGSKKADRPTGC
jgi:type IV pilus assembly protein PilA